MIILSLKVIKIFIVLTSDACIENQLFGVSGIFYQIVSDLEFYNKRSFRALVLF